MAKPKIIRRDISNDPQALLKVVSAPEFRSALLDCGFTNVGFLETKVSGLLTLKQIETRLAPSDAAWLLNQAENGDAYEVFGSGDKTTFAAIDNHFGELVLVFVTIAEDGTTIDTVMKPSRAPQTSEKITGVARTTLFNLFSQIRAWLNRLESGLQPIWQSSNRPKAGSHVELTETRDPKYLWRRHQSHLHEILKPNQEIPHHDNLELYLCALKRNEEIAEYVGKWYVILHFATIISSLVIVCLLFLEETLILSPFMRYIPDMALLLIFLLNGPVMTLIQYLGYAFVRENILPELPGPKLENVPTLMGKITPV